jgi:EAL domain-containing protein (putative c-di-GMP-specific phosphodiesterase class I)
LSLAQKTELIVPFQHWALRRLADQTAAWRTKLDRLRVSLDISTVQLRASHLERLLEHLREYLDGRGCGLELELDEGSLMDCQEQALSACDRIRNLTLPIALDHFGSGLSSLTRIRSLPLTRLKLAGILIRDVESDAGAAAVVSAMVALGHGLGLKVLAQDVETPGQLAFLQEIGCDEAQGSLLSPPLTTEKFAELLERICHTGPGPKGPELPPGLSSRAHPGLVGAFCGALRRGRTRLRALASRRRPA